MQLTEHFTLAEATKTSVEADNTPSEAQLATIKSSAVQLEKVRAVLGVAINVNSWFRSPTVNRMVGGASTSAHLQGFAIDCNAQGFSVAEACAKIKSAGIKFDQLIDEKSPSGVTWIHISFDPRYRQQHLKMRNGVYTKA